MACEKLGETGEARISPVRQKVDTYDFIAVTTFLYGVVG